MTTFQWIDQGKTLRRFGRGVLQPGNIIGGVQKAMGLNASECVERPGLIRVIRTDPEPLHQIIPGDEIRAGIPDWSPDQGGDRP